MTVRELILLLQRHSYDLEVQVGINQDSGPDESFSEIEDVSTREGYPNGIVVIWN